MTQISKRSCLPLLLAFSLLGCEPTEESSPAIEASTTAAATAIPVAKTCYQNLTGTGENTDAQVLILNRQDPVMSGEYHWLPAFKDRRLGRFSGEQTEQGIAVVYRYEQEGTKGSENLTLVPQADQIRVSGGAPELGLTADLKQVDCEQLVSIPEF